MELVASSRLFIVLYGGSRVIDPPLVVPPRGIALQDVLRLLDSPSLVRDGKKIVLVKHREGAEWSDWIRIIAKGWPKGSQKGEGKRCKKGVGQGREKIIGRCSHVLRARR